MSASGAGFSIKISPDGRSFVDQQDRPWFFCGDTQWELMRFYTVADARTILDKRTAQGFNAFLVMFNGVPNSNSGVAGARPWLNNNPLTPNETYLKHADSILALCATYDAIFIIGVFHAGERDLFTLESARSYAKSIATRYKDISNIVWCMYPNATDSYKSICKEFAAGLQEGDAGGHLITMHPDPAPASSSFMHDEPWLAFNTYQACIYVDRIVPLAQTDYSMTPAKPTVMGEGAYEGDEFGKVYYALDMRKQAYWTHCAGAHHVYGNMAHWQGPDWTPWIDSEGANDMLIYKQVITGLFEWWDWVPDQSLIAQGEGSGEWINTACRSSKGDWALVYVSSNTTVTINLTKLGSSGPFTATWIDPRSGDSTPAGSQTPDQTLSYATPAGWEDAVLVFTNQQATASWPRAQAARHAHGRGRTAEHLISGSIAASKGQENPRAGRFMINGRADRMDKGMNPARINVIAAE